MYELNEYSSIAVFGIVRQPNQVTGLGIQLIDS